MRRNFRLIACVIAAVAFVAWIARVAPGGSPVAHDTARVTPLPGVPRPAAVSSGFAGAPAAGTQLDPAQAAAAPPNGEPPSSAPPEVQEATERRQTAKITRGMVGNPGGGVRIEAAPPGSVAGQMHLLPGDVLMSVNGEAVTSPEEFARLYRAGGVQGEYVVIRDGREVHRR